MSGKYPVTVPLQPETSRDNQETNSRISTRIKHDHVARILITVSITNMKLMKELD